MMKMFEPYQLKGREVKNRVVFPPTVMFDESVSGGEVNERVIAHYKDIARAGCGIMIVEATTIAQDGPLSHMQLGIWDDKFIPGLSELAKAAHDEGAVALIQIMHAGGRASRLTRENPAAPSARQYGDNWAREMTVEEIEEMADWFESAAVRAQKSGFDGVELHSCHGFLLSQFLSPITNTREDEYGRDRTKLAADVIRRIRTACGDDFIIAARTHGNDPDIAASIAAAKAFEAAGADLLHISHGINSEMPPDLDYDSAKGRTMICAAGIEISKHMNVPVIVVNGIRTPEQAHSILEDEDVEFIALCKGYLCDLEWIEKARRGAAVRACVNCKRCLRFSGVHKCVLNGKVEQ